MSETEKHTGISILHNLSDDPDESDEGFNKLPLPKRSFIYNALMEGLTNGIRHGAANRFEFTLTENDGFIHFLLSNNGKTFEKIDFGYGLSKILGDVKQFGGQLEIRGQNVCTMEIFLPVENHSEMEAAGQ